MAYFLKKSILSAHNGEKSAKSIKMKLKSALKIGNFFFDFFKINFKASYGIQALSECVWDLKVSQEAFQLILEQF